MPRRQTISTLELKTPCTNGHAIEPAPIIEPTAEDILSQFPALVEQNLLIGLDGEERHWITVLDQSYRWAGTHYEHVRNTDLQNDIVRIDVGDSAGIEVDAYLGKTFKGIVTQVANSAKSSTAMSTDQVTKYEVKILILRSSYEAIMLENNGKMPFRPGMSSTVHVYTKQELNVLAVPVSSITMKEKKDKPEEKEEVVFIVENGKAVQKAIKTGIQDTKYIKITEGIKPGVMVITAPYEAINLKIKDGIAVKVVDKEILYEEKN